MKPCSFYVILYLLFFTSGIIFSQNSIIFRNDSTPDKLINKKTSFKNDFKFQFSLGGGVRFYNHFNQAEPIVNTDLGFRLSKHFVLLNGAEFSIHKYHSYEFPEFGVEKTQIFASLFIAPSFFLQTNKLMLYAGGGPGYTIPAGPYGLHIFILCRAGYKITKGTSINLSVKAPWYIGEKEIEGLSASAMYTFVF